MFLKENRICVLRFRNEEVERDIDDVLRRIREYINNSINKLKRSEKFEAVQTPNPLT